MKRKILIVVGALSLLIMGFILYQRNIISRPADEGDAPATYGRAIHFEPSEGPYFGIKRGDDDRLIKFGNRGNAIACSDDSIGSDDEDAFAYNFTPLFNQPYTSVFLPEINAASKSYTISIPVNGAEKGDPVRAWIDFDGNGKFDDDEKATADYQTGNAVTLTWMLPYQLYSSLTYARFRTCKSIARDDIEYPTGEVSTGEDEDYAIRISASVQLPSGLRNQLMLEGITGANTMDQVLQVMNRQKLVDISIQYLLRGSKPGVLAINNLQEPSVTGLYIEKNTKENSTDEPIVTVIKFSRSVENLSFQLLDIDGGDRIKVEGFYKGRFLKQALNNLSDNYYYNYNAQSSELYGQRDSDAGRDSIRPSSIDMGVEIYFKGFTDSVRLSYYNDAVEKTGAYTLGLLSGRMYSFDPYVVKEISTDKSDNSIALSWKTDSDNNVAAYVLERSTNGITFEVIARLNNENAKNNICEFTDSLGSPVPQLFYYRIKTVSIDNSAAYSPVVRVRRTKTITTAGYTPIDMYSKDTIALLLLTNMKGLIQANMYNYEGKLIKRWNYKNKITLDTIVISKLPALKESFFYLELVNDRKKYLRELIKRN